MNDLHFHPCFHGDVYTQYRHELAEEHNMPLRLATLKDNYSWILTIRSPQGDIQGLAVIDTTDSPEIKQFFTHCKRPIEAIINTHHHWDHTGGNDYLVRHHRPKQGIYGSIQDRSRIPHLSHGLADGDTFRIGQYSFEAFTMDGHTKGHMMFYESRHHWLFTGDAVFSLGCGRMFEGTAHMMVESLDKLKRFPPQTLIFCGHEYTLTNVQFALTIDPHNTQLGQFYHSLKQHCHHPSFGSVPSTLEFERKHNPFLRLDDPTFLAQAAIPNVMRQAHQDPALKKQLFLWLRTKKDEFVPSFTESQSQ